MEECKIPSYRDRRENGVRLIRFVRKSFICKSIEDLSMLHNDISVSLIDMNNNIGTAFSFHKILIKTSLKPPLFTIFFSQRNIYYLTVTRFWYNYMSRIA